MKTNQLENGTFSITLDLPDKGQCTLKTECTTRAQLKDLVRDCNLEAIERLAKADKLSAQLIRKLTLTGSTTVAHAIEEWKAWLKVTATSDLTADSYQRNVSCWYNTDVPDRLMDVTLESLSGWVNKDDGTKASTRSLRLASLRSFFGYCADKEYLTPNPTLTIRVRMKSLTHEQKESRKKVPFTDAEVQKMIDYIWTEICRISMKRNPKPYESHRFANLSFWDAAIRIGRLTGLRLGDICCLEFNSFKDSNTMIVWTDKRDARVVIPITEELSEALGHIPPGNGVHCFPHQREAITDPKRRHLLCVQFSALLKSAGIKEPHSFHELRHTRATELWNQGMPLEDIAEAMGHSSTDITKGYIHRDFEL